MFRIGKRGNEHKPSQKEVEKTLSELLGDLYSYVERYAKKKNMRIVDALRELVNKGYRYHELEEMYGDPSRHREIWDKRWYYFRVEAAYLNCRLRLRDVINDLRALALSFSSTVSELETMYRRCALTNENAKAHLDRLRDLVNYYMDTYIHSYRKYEDTGSHDSDEPSEREVIESVEKILEEYRKRMRSGEAKKA
ncbi:hypothetical protein PYJP_07680 [Pyrofollis japonicus]|uniref:hypothetical protein n=1 Tax=Pyrofollis japonicus TaxID=3060460 RepID=UPI00295B196F|nr:hypothetical protein [Pyrofollis japonicus]BEP17416.1 hypothetical protein PYJP_07680 [Pyrofollis japonicus]